MSRAAEAQAGMLQRRGTSAYKLQHAGMDAIPSDAQARKQNGSRVNSAAGTLYGRDCGCCVVAGISGGFVGKFGDERIMAAKGSEASDVVEVVQERRCVQGSKRMGKERVVSKEMIDSLDARLARVEISLGDIHKRLDFLDDRVVRGAETCLSQRKEDGILTPRLGSAGECRGESPRLPERLPRGCEADHASRPMPNRPASTTFHIRSICDDAVHRVGASSCGQQRSAVDRTQVLETELDEGVKHSGGGGCHGPPRRKRGCCNAEAHQRTSSSTRAWMLCLPTLKRASRMVRG
ncbi:hypothetical protein OWV82_010727 [Melia azedarach]|uniref:Uncharacterized protein n=1 Tax=Melia azedarach TaxID=155640 RepID=A0ACC1Y785_MELAZ|nr:hypothetical protein OWV82_010727 [Melia azedarach]